MVKDKPKIKSGGRFKILKRITVIMLLFMVVLIVAALIFAPAIAKNYINKHGKELAGRNIHIDKLNYNFFTSTLKISGFKYFEQNDTDIFVALDTFLVDMKPLKLLNDEIYIEQLQLINPSGSFIQNDTVFNFDDLVTFFTGADTAQTKPEPETSTSYKLNLNNLEMKNGLVEYTDLQLHNTLKLEEVSFIIPQIIWSKLDSSKADIEFKLANGGNFASSLNYNADNGEYSGFVQIEKMELATFLPYLKQYLKVSGLEGKASGLMNFKGLDSDIYQFEMNGNFDFDSLAIFDESNRKVIGGDYSRIILNPSKPMVYEVFVDTVKLFKPYIYLALEDSLFNFEKMIVETPETVSADTSVDEMPMNIVLNNFIIESGLMDFSDQTMRETFDYELSEIAVDMDTFSLQDDWVNINAKMKLNKRGTLEAKLGVNPLEPLKRIELEYVLTDFQLPDINVYSKHYAGLPILFGDMYYVNKTKIADRQLESNNQLIIRNVKMGRKAGGLYDIPIKLALFVLKDINGDIILDIPVKGDLSDPKVKIGAIVWDTFKSFMFKIVASPFKALGNLLGADPKEIEEIAFDYADTTLVAKQIRSFDLLLEIEKTKPELLIEMHYLNDKKLERIDAAGELAQNSFFLKTGKRAKLNNREYLKFLSEETGKDSLLMQDYEVLFAPAHQVDSVLRQREIRRMDMTKKYLTSKNDSTTIKIFGYKPDEVLNIGSRPKFEVRYILAEDAETP